MFNPLRRNASRVIIGSYKEQKAKAKKLAVIGGGLAAAGYAKKRIAAEKRTKADEAKAAKRQAAVIKRAKASAARDKKISDNYAANLLKKKKR